MITEICIKAHGDERGMLHSIEFGEDTPFVPKRVYYILNTLADVRRGSHAHKNLNQLFICVSGSCVIEFDDSITTQSYSLSSPGQGILVEGVYWREIGAFSHDCVLLVLASEHYDEDDYIRNYHEFVAYKKLETLNST